ncbi:MAG: 50S ribosomal protein L29 [Clostridiales bacterium]|nr:50S ribosomal protein L29 [Clostridiales bacterium]MBR5039526.1 50S ribosomal protein L29 [Clostridiales bacterium]
MTTKELRSKSAEELQQELVALKDELFKLRFQHATNQLENPQRLGAVKRDIARVNTILREIELKAN